MSRTRDSTDSSPVMSFSSPVRPSSSDYPPVVSSSFVINNPTVSSSSPQHLTALKAEKNCINSTDGFTLTNSSGDEPPAHLGMQREPPRADGVDLRQPNSNGTVVMDSGLALQSSFSRPLPSLPHCEFPRRTPPPVPPRRRIEAEHRERAGSSVNQDSIDEANTASASERPRRRPPPPPPPRRGLRQFSYVDTNQRTYDVAATAPSEGVVGHAQVTVNYGSGLADSSSPDIGQISLHPTITEGPSDLHVVAVTENAEVLQSATGSTSVQSSGPTLEDSSEGSLLPSFPVIPHALDSSVIPPLSQNLAENSRDSDSPTVIAALRHETPRSVRSPSQFEGLTRLDFLLSSLDDASAPAGGHYEVSRYFGHGACWQVLILCDYAGLACFVRAHRTCECR